MQAALLIITQLLVQAAHLATLTWQAITVVYLHVLQISSDYFQLITVLPVILAVRPVPGHHGVNAQVRASQGIL